MAVTACSDTASTQRISEVEIALATTPCESEINPNCIFINSPVALKKNKVKFFGTKSSYFPTVEDLSFIDSQSKSWLAPRDTLTDGASIPPIFIPIIGAPDSKEFVNAAAVHDAYCGTGNEKGARFHTENWQNVHRMFYSALRIGGTPAIKAKIMYSAVYLGGPRWSQIKAPASNRIGFRSNPTESQFRLAAAYPARTLGHVSDDEMVRQLKEAIAYINQNNPTLMDIEYFLLQLERRTLLFGTHQRGSADELPDVPAAAVFDPSYDGIPM